MSDHSKASWEVIVRDGTGHTFVFNYRASSQSEAISEYKRAARRAGIKKFKNIKIFKVEKVS